MDFIEKLLGYQFKYSDNKKLHWDLPGDAVVKNLPCNAEPQQSHFWAYTPRKPELKETHVPQCSLQHWTWKQPRCPSADEWIRKRWYIYTMEYYSAIKKNTFESVLMRWMKLEPILQSEVSQKEKHQNNILSIYMEFRKMVMVTLYEKQQKRHRCIKQSFGLCGRGRGGMIWENGIETCIIYDTNRQSRFDA